MSRDTPTIDQLRHLWALDEGDLAYNVPGEKDYLDRAKEFDRLITSIQVKAVEVERRRITDLLAAEIERLMDYADQEAVTGGDPAWDIDCAEAVKRCVQLIEGKVAL